MKKVLQVVACLEKGGTEAFLMNQYRNIDRSKLQFDFFVFREKDYPYLEEIRALGGKVIFGIPPKSTNLPAFLKLAVRVMREGQYAAVHSHVNLTNAWVLLAAKIAGIPVRISHSHDTSGKGGGFFKRLYRQTEIRILKRCANVYLACGQDAGEYLYGRSFFRSKGKVIRNGIDVQCFLAPAAESIHAARSSFDLPEDCSCVIGNITRFEEKKNQLFMLEVFAAFLRICPSAVLVLGGPDGGLLAAAKAFAAKLGISDRVRFVGSRDDVPACLKAFDLVLFPSRFEGLPIALLEAQAADRLCVVSTAVSREADMGIGRIVFLDLTESPERWADQMLRAWRERKALSASEIMEAFCRNGYDVKHSAKELSDLYLYG